MKKKRRKRKKNYFINMLLTFWAVFGSVILFGILLFLLYQHMGEKKGTESAEGDLVEAVSGVVVEAIPEVEKIPEEPEQEPEEIREEEPKGKYADILADFSYMEENNIPAYNETTHKGIVRHIIIRTGQATGEVMACLVINADSLPKTGRLLEKLLDCDFSIYKKNMENILYNSKAGINTGINNIDVNGIYTKTPFIKSICVNINKDRTNVILGPKTNVIYGTPYIKDYIGNIMYHISPVSFYQVNHAQTEKLYEKVMEFADLKGSEIVWDMYCGIGTISLFLAQKAAKVYGVEIIGQAVEDARANAALNNTDNVEFFHGAAEKVVPLQYEKSGGMLKADVVTLDPPRKGCGESLLNTVADMEPARIVYVSCDPATLARDLKYLCSRGYKLCKVQPVDMFGQSSHIENVCLLYKVI